MTPHRLVIFLLLVALPFFSPLVAQSTLTLEEREAEVQQASRDVEYWKPLLASSEQAVVEEGPRFIPVHRGVQAIELDVSERKALIDVGIEALDPAKKQAFEDAAPAFAVWQQKLTTYFEAYDRFKDAEIRTRVVGSVVEVLEHWDLLDKVVTEKERALLEPLFQSVLEKEVEYRRLHADANGRNHERAYSIVNTLAAAETFEKKASKLLMREGAVPKVAWYKRLGRSLANLGSKIRSYARLTRIGITTLPAAARIFTYLINPFRDQPDPAKVTRMMRFLGKSYAWGAGMKIRVSGAEHIPQGQRIIYAFSHRSGLEDSMVMVSVLPTDYAFMAGVWAFRAFPKVGERLGREKNVILVGGYKDAEKTRRIDAVQASVETLQDGLDLAIFPEGATPSDHQETRPLRAGLDVIASQVAEQPVSIVAVGIDDPANGIGDVEHVSLDRGIDVNVVFSRPIDPLKFKAVPGEGRQQLLLDTIRAFYHRSLYRPDAPIELATEAQTLTVPEESDEVTEARFEELHAEP